jgi:hypothetical protein
MVRNGTVGALTPNSLTRGPWEEASLSDGLGLGLGVGVCLGWGARQVGSAAVGALAARRNPSIVARSGAHLPWDDWRHTSAVHILAFQASKGRTFGGATSALSGTR